MYRFQTVGHILMGAGFTPTTWLRPESIVFAVTEQTNESDPGRTTEDTAEGGCLVKPIL